MDSADATWLQDLWARVVPTDSDAASLGWLTLLIVLGVAIAIVGLPPLWRALRLGVTLVHELGHAMVGVLVGRRFTGFVLRGDMSGHAVTAGPPRGFGRVISTWAGYPAPALVGAALAWLGPNGWAAPAITVSLVVLLVSAVRVRSVLTALVMIVALAATAALWWWRNDVVQAHVLLGAGTVLVIGAWRHLGAVWRGGGATSDPKVLASLTGVPAFVWNVTFALVCLGASVVVAYEYLTVLGLAA